jgi:hypothetical protein
VQNFVSKGFGVTNNPAECMNAVIRGFKGNDWKVPLENLVLSTFISSKETRGDVLSAAGSRSKLARILIV